MFEKDLIQMLVSELTGVPINGTMAPVIEIHKFESDPCIVRVQSVSKDDVSITESFCGQEKTMTMEKDKALEALEEWIEQTEFTFSQVLHPDEMTAEQIAEEIRIACRTGKSYTVEIEDGIIIIDDRGQRTRVRVV